MRAEFEVTIATPLSAGWYDPAIVDRNFYIRPTEVKGVWRWWARAFAAGALYEAGCTGPDFLRRVHEIVADKLGLGSTKAASRYDLTVEVLEEPRVDDSSNENLQRFNLLNRDRKKKQMPGVEYAIGGRFRIVLESDDDLSLAASILAVALTLSGIGKGSRKALGSLDIVRVSGAAPSRPLKELIEEIRRQMAVPRCGRPVGLPKIAAIANGVFEVYRVIVDYRRLHNIFLRSERSRLARRSGDPLDHMAWFLGLPRVGKMKVGKTFDKESKKEIETGYLFITDDVKRRASPVFATWHSRNHRYGYGEGGYLAIFLSQDWPSKLCWVSGKEKKQSGTDKDMCDDKKRGIPIYINEKTLNEAKSKFIDVLSQIGWRPQRIWP